MLISLSHLYHFRAIVIIIDDVRIGVDGLLKCLCGVSCGCSRDDFCCLLTGIISSVHINIVVAVLLNVFRQVIGLSNLKILELRLYQFLVDLRLILIII